MIKGTKVGRIWRQANYHRMFPEARPSFRRKESKSVRLGYRALGKRNTKLGEKVQACNSSNDVLTMDSRFYTATVAALNV